MSPYELIRPAQGLTWVDSKELLLKAYVLVPIALVGVGQAKLKNYIKP
jgi:hypothetical protein